MIVALSGVTPPLPPSPRVINEHDGTWKPVSQEDAYAPSANPGRMSPRFCLFVQIFAQSKVQDKSFNESGCNLRCITAIGSEARIRNRLLSDISLCCSQHSSKS